jgi:hypothetical protein
MNRYQIDKNQLRLLVKKSPLFIRVTLYFFTALFFLMPLVAFLIGALIYGFHIAYFIGIFFFAILGLYMLRISLWNTYGKEIITYQDNKINYTADYGWFKDKIKTLALEGTIKFQVVPYQYEDDVLARLIITTENDGLVCVTKMPFGELNEVIASDWVKKIEQRTVN